MKLILYKHKKNGYLKTAYGRKKFKYSITSKGIARLKLLDRISLAHNLVTELEKLETDLANNGGYQ